MQFLTTCILCLCVVTFAFGDMRLIAFNETDRVWMPREDVEKMITSGKEVHFMDITDTLHLGEGPRPRQIAIPSQPTQQAVVNPLLPLLSASSVQGYISYLSSYTTRYYTSQNGVQAVQWLRDEYVRHAGNRDDIEVSLFSHSWAQPSIIAKIIGTEPNLPVVILGGHVDSTSNGGTAPGADDDASGSSTVIEIFRVLSSQGFKPKRTIEFHGYAAEEAGLLGSQAIAQYYVNQGVDVAGMLQFDMTGYVRAGTTRTFGIVTDFTNPQLTAFLRACALEYTLMNPTNTACGYGCSDHASFYRAGYPSAFAFESTFANSNPYIHTTNDVLSHLNLQHSLEFAKLGLAFAIEISLE